MHLKQRIKWKLDATESLNITKLFSSEEYQSQT